MLRRLCAVALAAAALTVPLASSAPAWADGPQVHGAGQAFGSGSQHVYVSPPAQKLPADNTITPIQAKRLEQQIRDSGLPIFVAVLAYPAVRSEVSGPRSLGSAVANDAGNRGGIYAVVAKPYFDATRVGGVNASQSDVESARVRSYARRSGGIYVMLTDFVTRAAALLLPNSRSSDAAGSHSSTSNTTVTVKRAPKHTGRTILIVLGVLLGMALLAVGGAWWWRRKAFNGRKRRLQVRYDELYNQVLQAVAFGNVNTLSVSFTDQMQTAQTHEDLDAAEETLGRLERELERAEQVNEPVASMAGASSTSGGERFAGGLDDDMSATPPRQPRPPVQPAADHPPVVYNYYAPNYSSPPPVVWQGAYPGIGYGYYPGYGGWGYYDYAGNFVLGMLAAELAASQMVAFDAWALGLGMPGYHSIYDNGWYGYDSVFAGPHDPYLNDYGWGGTSVGQDGWADNVTVVTSDGETVDISGLEPGDEVTVTTTETDTADDPGDGSSDGDPDTWSDGGASAADEAAAEAADPDAWPDAGGADSDTSSDAGDAQPWASDSASDSAPEPQSWSAPEPASSGSSGGDSGGWSGGDSGGSSSDWGGSSSDSGGGDWGGGSSDSGGGDWGGGSSFDSGGGSDFGGGGGDNSW